MTTKQQDLRDARNQLESEIKQYLSDRIDVFTFNTGLKVDGVDVSFADITEMADKHREVAISKVTVFVDI
ncbi:MAG: hypothetical protein GY774_04390 [Planctomycetes bacterium]|nr:hypothetical protein [Planctomycetota bacterium]